MSAVIRLLCTASEIEEALDEVRAPTESGGIELSYAGRIRALAFRLTTEANRLRTRAECPYEAGCPAHGPQDDT